MIVDVPLKENKHSPCFKWKCENHRGIFVVIYSNMSLSACRTEMSANTDLISTGFPAHFLVKVDREHYHRLANFCNYPRGDSVPVQYLPRVAHRP